MRIVRIGKGGGKFREIYIPDTEERQCIRQAFPDIRSVMMNTCDYAVCHGFTPGRSPVTNAAMHIGHGYTLSMDLSSWFDTVTRAMLEPLVPGHLLQDTLVDGVPRQGLPTSPMLANIAAAAMDTELSSLGAVYSRYADDLTFSVDSKEEVFTLLEQVPAVIERHRFVLNRKKTRVQGWRQGHRIITGVGVGEQDVYETRRNRRRRRAAVHQGHTGSATGLGVWMNPPGMVCPICWSMPRGSVGSHMDLWHHIRMRHGPLHERALSHERIGQEVAARAVCRGSVRDYGPVVLRLRDIVMAHLLVHGG